MYKVFFKDSCFLLTDERNFPREATHFLAYGKEEEMQAFVFQLLQGPHAFFAVIRHDDAEELFARFQACFRTVEAAGGAVWEGGRLLVIKRFGVYDLPKGHREPAKRWKSARCAKWKRNAGCTGCASPLRWQRRGTFTKGSRCGI